MLEKIQRFQIHRWFLSVEAEVRTNVRIGTFSKTVLKITDLAKIIFIEYLATF